MIVQGYLIMEPGADRPYFCHNYPAEYARKPGSMIYRFTLNLPEFENLDGRIITTAEPVEEPVAT